jgi:hypothetical protein
MLLTPDEFAIGWGAGDLVRWDDAAPAGAIPDEARRFLGRVGLPALIRYSEGPRVAKITFCRLGAGPTPVLSEPIVGGPLAAEWSRYRILGDEFFCNGAAWWCIDERSGSVERIDIELGEPIAFANSSVAHFASCALAAVRGSGRWSQRAAEWPSQVAELKRTLAEIDPAAMASDRNFWPHCLDFIDDDGGPPCVVVRGPHAEGLEALSRGPW